MVGSTTDVKTTTLHPVQQSTFPRSDWLLGSLPNASNSSPLTGQQLRLPSGCDCQTCHWRRTPGGHKVFRQAETRFSVRLFLCVKTGFFCKDTSPAADSVAVGLIHTSACLHTALRHSASPSVYYTI